MIIVHLRQFLSFFLVLILLSCNTTNGATELEISEEQVKSDLRQLQSELEHYHAGYDWYTSIDSLNLYFNRAAQNAQGMSRVDFYRVVKRLVAKVRCGHTRVSAPSDLIEAFERETAFLPLSVVLLGNELYVFDTQENDAQIQRSDRILSINGQSTASIIEKIYVHLSADGMNTTAKARRTEIRFAYYYSLFVKPNATSYELGLERKGSPIKVTLDGVGLNNIPRPKFKRNTTDLLTLEDKGDHYSMRIATFGSSSINRSGLDYYDFLSASFSEISASPKPVILDLRGNGGGDDLYGAKLVSYFVDEPFRYFDKIEVTKDYSGYGSIEETQGTRLMTSHDGLNVQQPSTNSFDGSLYVLIDGLSFSTCADVASVLKANQRGVLIGEETGGGSGGNTSGNSSSLTLDHSSIRINIPMWKYSTAPDPDRIFGRGVMPDVEVSPNIHILNQNDDSTMETALELLHGN